MGCKHLLSSPWKIFFNQRVEQVEAGRKPDHQKMLSHASASIRYRQWSFLGTTGLRSPSKFTFSQIHSGTTWYILKILLKSKHIPKHRICFLFGSGWKDVQDSHELRSWSTGTTDLRKGPTLVVCGLLNKLKHTIQLYWAITSQSTNSDKPLEGYLLPILLLPAGFWSHPPADLSWGTLRWFLQLTATSSSPGTGSWHYLTCSGLRVCPVCVSLAFTVLPNLQHLSGFQRKQPASFFFFLPTYLGHWRAASPSVATCNCTAWRSRLGGTSISTAQRFRWLTRLCRVWNCFPQMGHSGTTGLLEDDICVSSISSRHLGDNGKAYLWRL